MRLRSRHAVASALIAIALGGCASADKNQSSTTAKQSGSGAGMSVSGGSSAGMAGMNMDGASAVGTEVPSVNGIKPVAIRTIATSYWQDMEIQAQTMTPVAFVVFTGSGKEQTFKPGKNASFHLMIMLTDRHTHFQIPYASVWATILNTKGQAVYDERQWPMISEYMGSHYGNNVSLPRPGHYTLKLLISPPVSARHLEYAHIWQKPHTVTESFTWKPTS
ncbi:MAG TPA: iron transporter [Solirubrobacteraceae bacterium]|jgi:uncharacterized protein involved in high-affinity Fe2+ transport|nr:iron transporter [Solirubrobacteraceae bacterium]